MKKITTLQIIFLIVLAICGVTNIIIPKKTVLFYIANYAAIIVAAFLLGQRFITSYKSKDKKIKFWGCFSSAFTCFTILFLHVKILMGWNIISGSLLLFCSFGFIVVHSYYEDRNPF